MNATASNWVEQCEACVEQGFTWCRADGFFGGDSTCVVNATSGFFGDCSDTEFGSHDFTSKLDCDFDSENGELILVVVILVPLILIALAACLKRRSAARNRSANIVQTRGIQQQQHVMMMSQQHVGVVTMQQQQPQPQGRVLGFVPTQQQPVIVGGQPPIVQAVPVPVPAYQP